VSVGGKARKTEYPSYSLKRWLDEGRKGPWDPLHCTSEEEGGSVEDLDAFMAQIHQPGQACRGDRNKL